jgi:hypothetical protein
MYRQCDSGSTCYHQRKQVIHAFDIELIIHNCTFQRLFKTLLFYKLFVFLQPIEY